MEIRFCESVGIYGWRPDAAIGLKARADGRLQVTNRKIGKLSAICDRDNIGGEYGCTNRNSLERGVPFELAYAGKK